MALHKVIVIGAGPAGLTTCFWLQKFGIPHMLLEKSSMPREKSCADNLTSNAIRRINEINEAFIPDMISKKILNPVYGIDLYGKKGNSLRLKYKSLEADKETPSCYAVKRSELDQYLFERVTENPLTTVVQNCYVNAVDISDDSCTISTKSGDIYHSELLIVATGSNSNPIEKSPASKKENIHNAVGIRAYYEGLQHEPNYSSWFLKNRIMPGGFYITPFQDGQYNVNLVVRTDTRDRKKLNLVKEFNHLIETDPELKPIFQNAKRVSSFAGSQLKLGTKKRTVCGARYMLTGDSAGLIDLITANGIPQAMTSGKLAAMQAKDCIVENDFSASFIKRYEDTLSRNLKKELILGKIANPLLSFSAINKFLISSLGFITKGSSQNSSIIKLAYAKRPALLLLNPLFYFRIIKESISN